MKHFINYIEKSKILSIIALVIVGAFLIFALTSSSALMGFCFASGNVLLGIVFAIFTFGFAVLLKLVTDIVEIGEEEEE